MSHVVEVGDHNFEQEVIRSALPVMVDFWAPWCAPCRTIAPLVEEIARAYAGRLKVAKLNVDENPQTPARFGVRGIPNLIFVKEGSVKEQLLGAVPKVRLVEAVERLLS
jgi:thioredoxin 1